MTTEDHDAAIAEAVTDLAGRFMLDPKTRQRGAELGFPGEAFVIVGRAGVLGRTAPDVAASALVLHEPTAVARAWRAGLDIIDTRDVSAVFAACAHTWARRSLADAPVDRLAVLAGTVVHSAAAAGAPLFAGWRAMPEPSDAAAVAVHRLYLLRELRAALHGTCVVAAGLAPADAVAASDGDRAARYGWTPAAVVDAATAARVTEAGDRADRLWSGALDVLDAGERDEFRGLVAAARDAAARAVNGNPG
jgi:hypothetical protein